jgi:hypothetical protein
MFLKSDQTINLLSKKPGKFITGLGIMVKKVLKIEIGRGKLDIRY